MWGVKGIQGVTQKVSSFLFDEEEEEEIGEPEKEEKAEKEEIKNRPQVRTKAEKQVVGGMEYREMPVRHEEIPFRPQFVVKPAKPARTERPKLTVHESPSLQIKVFVPRSFDEVQHIADCLKKKQAVVINYEMTAPQDQFRISDFMNGTCYVLNGGAQVITKQSVLYVPQGVTINKDSYSSFENAMPQFGKM